MINWLAEALGSLDNPPTAQEIAEALWLAPSIPVVEGVLRAAASRGSSGRRTGPADAATGEPPASERRVGLRAVRPDKSTEAANFSTAGTMRGQDATGISVRVPGVAALVGAASMARALRPLSRRYPSTTRSVLDEEGTVASIADFGVWSAQYRPMMDRWLDFTLVVDDSASMRLWRQTVSEFRTVLDRLGAFRDLRTWRFDGDQNAPKLTLRSESGGVAHRPRELADPAGRRALLLVSDCMGAAWRSGSVSDALAAWSKTAPVAVLQPLPERLWRQSRLNYTPVTYHSSRPAQPTAAVSVRPRGSAEIPATRGVAIPVLELTSDARWLASWANLLARAGRATGVALYTGAMTTGTGQWQSAGPAGLDAEDLLLRFREQASPLAYALAGYLAAVPLSLPVMRLVQAVMLPQSRAADLAEVLLSDLIEPPRSAATWAEDAQYEFRPRVREQLLAGLPRGETLRVLEDVGRFLAARSGYGPEFPAIVESPDGIMAAGRQFAQVAHTALQAIGGHYGEIAAKLELQLEDSNIGQPTWQASEGEQGWSGSLAVASAAPSASTRRTTAQQIALRADASTSTGGNVTQPSFRSRTASERPSLPLGWRTVPRRNPNFTGRENELLELRSQLSSSVTALVPHALYGLGGVGKTQLAVEYVCRFASEYDLIWWIKAEEEDSIVRSLVDLAGVLDLTPAEDQSVTVNQVLGRLEKDDLARRWLLVYDDADDPEMVLKYFPTPVGDILITSLNQDWVDQARTIRVGVFSRAESVELITRRGRGITAEDADQLAERLGDLPLVIEQAATWQRQTGMGVAEYLEQLDKQRQKILTVTSSTGAGKHVAEAWGIAFDRLMEEDRAAADLLQLCAFFGPEPISIQLLHYCKSVPGIPEALRAAAEDGIGLHSAIRQIGRYGLAEVEAEERLWVHRLVQAVLRDRVAPSDQKVWQRLVHLILAEANPGDPDSSFSWPLLEQIGLHVVRATSLIEGDGDNVRQVVLDQIRYRYVRGNFERSRDLAATTVDVWRQRYDESDKLLLIASRHLGNALRSLGRYAEARKINHDTLDHLRTSLGEDDEYTLLAAGSYAADLRVAGEFKQALDLDKRALTRLRTIYGNETRITLRCQNNLAVDLRLMGQFNAALEQDTEILQLRTLRFGADDQDTLFAQCMVARDLRGVGDYTGALDIYERVLPAAGDLLDDHEDVLNSRLSYGLTLLRAGFYERAMREIEEVSAIFQTRFGPEHPGVMRSMTMLSSPARLLGEHGRARDLADRALRLAIKLYGEDHIFTTLYNSNLAITWRGLGSNDVARQADEVILPKMRSTLGDDHRFTLSSTANLATSYHRLDNYELAKELSQTAYDRSIPARGAANPLTLACACNLALDLIATGAESEGERLAVESIGQLEVILGPDSKVVADLRNRQRYEFDIEPPRV